MPNHSASNVQMQLQKEAYCSGISIKARVAKKASRLASVYPNVSALLIRSVKFTNCKHQHVNVWKDSNQSL